jgi:hypothetical protein
MLSDRLKQLGAKLLGKPAQAEPAAMRDKPAVAPERKLAPERGPGGDHELTRIFRRGGGGKTPR